MKSREKFIIVAYILGISLDAGSAISFGLDFLKGLTSGMPGDTLRYYGWATGLMLGWTTLLIWGVLRPLQRRATLLITAFPVVLIFFFSYGLMSLQGIVTWQENLPFLGTSTSLLVIFTTAYLLARGSEQERPSHK